MLHIYNTLTKTKARFIPIEPGKVRMYVCGMTVYDYCHLGHGRVLVVFDMVVRYLRARDYQVTYVRNVTDIDDKIIKRANENGEQIDALTGRFIQAMHEDADVLGVLRPDQEPRATLYMREILDMIATLVERGYAYAASNGDVYYRVRKFADYGQLSGKALDDLRVGARVEADEMKQDPLDFVLWKAAKPGEPSWDSPWGAGRPGWHIECSAMSTACLGQHFDIHGGGLDLQFPHHENEIAQSEGATGHKFVNVWMHNGFVRVDNEKMSKSLGNFFTIREVLKKYDPEVVRYFILASHYHSPLNYAEDSLDNAKAALTRLYTALIGNRSCVCPKGPGASTSAISAPVPDGALPRPSMGSHGGRNDLPPATVDAGGVIATYEESFFAAMDDDFNTPVALAVLFDLARDINRLQATDPAHAQALGGELRKLAGILGLLQREPQAFLQGSPVADGVSAEHIETLIRQRAEARKNKQWAESDRLRDELKASGVILEDTGGVTTWRRG